MMKSPDLSAMCHRCATLPILLLALLLLSAAANAERDFNVNDSQVPVIEPKDAPAYKQDPYVTELMRCQHSQSEIVLSLLLRKHDWSDLSTAKRAHVQSKLSKFFAIPREFITLDSVAKRELTNMHKLAMRKGGKGQKQLEALNHRLGRASFMIGCGANYFSMGEPIAKQIAHQIKDGTIGALTEENFGLWFIWRKELKSRSQRKRRQSEGSGAEEDDYDYGDDDEEQAPEPVTVVPTTHAHRHHHGVSEQTEQTAGISSSASLPSSSSISSSPVGNLDAEIEESVSQLESVISKTIENTKNIKELPVLSVDEDVDDVEDVDLQQLGVPAAPVIVASNEKQLDTELSDVEKQLTTTAASAPGNSNNNNDNQVDTALVTALDVAEHAATSTSQTTTSHNNNNNNNILDTPETSASNPATSSASASASTSFASSETVEMSTPPAAAVGSSTAATTVMSSSSSSSTVAAIDTDTVNTLTTTPLPILSSSSTTTISSSSPSSSSSATTTTFETLPTVATMPTTTATTTTSPTTTTTTTSTTTTQSQTPKPNENELEPRSTWPVTDVADADTLATMRSTLAEIDSEIEIEAEAESMSTTTHSTLSISPKAGDAVDALEAAAAGNGSSVPILTSNELDAPLASPIPATTRQPLLDTSSSTTTTDSSTDYVEPRQENTTPIIKMRLQKLAVTSGKAFSFVVPMETFHDAEDQSNLRLELTDKDGHELKASSWLQFNADKRELYGLPLDDAVSRWTYRLSATDSGNASVTETVEIAVQQHRAVRTINHEITIAVRINEKLGHNIDWQLKLIRAVAHTLGDGSSSALVVREIRQTSQEPQSASFVYFNETLPTSECPEVELKDVVRRLNAERLSDLVLPLLSIQSITGQLIGTCQKTELNKVKPTTQMAKNLPPMPRNQVDRVSATVGQLLVYKVPSDTFYDPNDNELTLSLKTKDHKEISPRNWMQFDSKNQEFYGIPKGSDTGTEEYLLIAEDSGGLSANDALVVVVSNAQRKELAMNFKAYLAIKHENFNAELQRKFVERIAQLNGDSNTNQVLVRTINQNHDQDGVIVYFYNASLYKMNNRCPHKEMEDVRSVYFDSDLKLKPAVRHALGAELNLTQMSAMTSSVCQYTDSSDINSLDNLPPNHKEPSLKPTSPEEYLATFILPAVIIVVMIILASIIACCLHRRRHKSGKMELGDEEERKSFRTKGIPVIFQDEFEEKPEIGNKSPVILKDEKPPLLPPSYNTSNMNGDNDVDEYVPPPAVVLGGREVRGKSPATPSYRKPPPYVSP
ncbi:serine-rich adhesin for platelets isoform X1 [Drosophila sulfurigaster albostrigata]|uniref:serine-rich adhesin for platelets isoform X1 n=1 Tax=Drosophila sulfurigaster albostrigata TaxID=89887 RepID=UPI002D21848A|nr:serine-rich adhesin for platelets isoform X1 [Drosophila sulfurigaster albostrigata]